MFDRQDAGIEE